MLSSFRIKPNNTNKRLKKAENTNSDNKSHADSDLKNLK